VFRPYAHARYEVFFMRLLFAVVVLLSVDHMLPPLLGESSGTPGIVQKAKMPYPTGIGHVLPFLTVLADETVAWWTHLVLATGLVLYISGFVLPISLAVVTAIHIAVFTLNNSQGSIHHGYQIISVTLLAQCIVAWLPWGFRLFGKILVLPEGLHLRDLSVYYSQLAIAGCYVIAGVTKMLASGPMWIVKSPLIAVQIHKSFDQKYYEYLDPALLEEGHKYADFAVQNPNLTRLILGGGLFLELFAFLVLIGRRSAALLGVSLIAMHLAIGCTMALHFPQNQQTDFVFLVNAPFWIVAAYTWLRRKRCPCFHSPRNTNTPSAHPRLTGASIFQ